MVAYGKGIQVDANVRSMRRFFQAVRTWAEVFEKTRVESMADSSGALPEDAKKALRRARLKTEDHQKPIALSLPVLA